MTTATDPMDITVSVPVASCLEIGEGFTTRRLAAGRYDVARPDGGPDVLEHVHAEMWQWAGEQGLELNVDERADGIHWRGRTEQFLTDPEAEPDRSTWAIDVASLLT